MVLSISQLASGNTSAKMKQWPANWLSCSLGEDLQSFLAHKIAHSLGLSLVLRRDIIPVGVGGVILAVGGQAARNANLRW